MVQRMKGGNMPKAILVFTLPEEREEFELAQKAVQYSIVLSDYSNWLRQMYKYENKKSVKIEDARTKLFELCNERGIEL